MANSSRLLNKEWKPELLLLAASFLVYFLYFHHVLLNLNSLLSSITGDALKNYYTFAYHIVNDRELLHFTGMNYPFGEHVIYTDCQPLLTFIFQVLPFTHGYIIGCLHFLMFFSFIITPVILYRILRSFEAGVWSSALVGLAIALLSPQFAKINGGHHGLAYGCVIPLSMLLIIRCARDMKLSGFLICGLYNFLLFLIHPYMGFGVSLFTFCSFFSLALFQRQQRGFFLIQSFVSGAVPMVAFKVFMLLTDQHVNRTVQPYGQTALVENIPSLLAPDFGPFKDLMNKLLPGKVMHFEGHSYIGFFTLLLFCFFIVVLFMRRQRLRVPPVLLGIFIASVILLLLSFGLHARLLDALGIDSASLAQFRAASRFAWFFYFALPVFLLVTLFRSFRETLTAPRLRAGALTISALYLLFNLWEAHYYFTLDKEAFWKFNNIFRLQPDAGTQGLVREISSADPQAIMTLPVFYLGSEMYDRIGSDRSMIPAMICSFHTKIPVFGAWMSRTSISETAAAIELLNLYKRNRPIEASLGKKDFAVLIPGDQLLPDEERLMKKVKLFYADDSLKIGRLAMKDVFAQEIPVKAVTIPAEKPLMKDELIYIPHEDRKPFTTASFMDYEKLFVLDSNQLRPGDYIVSFLYHYKETIFRSVACNLIITRGKGEDYSWAHNRGISVLSGYYPGFGVFEYKLNVEQGARYEFLIKGNVEQQYRVSSFMMRPDTMDVITVDLKGDSTINNFGLH